VTESANGRTQLIEVSWKGWPQGITAAVVEVARALRRAQAGDHVVAVVSEVPADGPHRGALREALRGLIHSSVRERPEVRVNLVFGGSPADRSKSVDYLTHAGFVYGATLELGDGS
jgi:hypothetical protein